MKKSSLKNIVSLSISFACFFYASAQTLTIEQTIQLAIKNNYDITIAQNIASQANNNNTIGNAGFLPTVDINVLGSIANNATRQEFSNGLKVNQNNVQSVNLNTGAFLTWTVFDGFKMFATKHRLETIKSMGETNVKMQIENTLLNVIKAYYAIAMQKQLILGLNENIAVSEERLKIAQKQLEIGSVSKSEWLLAKVDLNTLKTSLIKQNTLLQMAKADLNQLLLQDVNTPIDVLDSIPVMPLSKYDDLKNSVLNNNSELLMMKKNIDVYNFSLSEGRSVLYPKINLHTNYIFNRTQNQAGFALFNQNLGLNIGFSASWNIFNGFKNTNNNKNLQLDVLNATQNFEKTKSLIHLNLSKAFKKLQDDLSILTLEEENLVFAKEYLDITLEQFKLGANTSIEIKMAQQAYQETVNRLVSARYNAKLSETEILKLSGSIIK